MQLGLNTEQWEIMLLRQHEFSLSNEEILSALTL